MKSILLNFENIESTKELHLLLKEKLGFPDFYGMNWDAFWDSITGLVEMPDKIEVTGWLQLKKNLPKDSEIFFNLLLKYNTQSYLKMIEVCMK